MEQAGDETMERSANEQDAWQREEPAEPGQTVGECKRGDAHGQEGDAGDELGAEDDRPLGGNLCAAPSAAMKIGPTFGVVRFRMQLNQVRPHRRGFALATPTEIVGLEVVPHLRVRRGAAAQPGLRDGPRLRRGIEACLARPSATCTPAL